MMRRRRAARFQGRDEVKKRFSVAAVFAALMVIPALAFAQIYNYQGHGLDDAKDTKVVLDVKGKKNQKGLVDEAWILEFVAKKVTFHCPGGPGSEFTTGPGEDEL